MRWNTSVLVILSTVFIFSHSGVFRTHAYPVNFEDENIYQSDNLGRLDGISSIELLEDEKLAEIGDILEKLLLMPWPKGSSPLLYVENYSNNIEEPEEENNLVSEFDFISSPNKRSRYYRKYPWKRQNTRYDAENRYLCQPSKDDVYRLLVALHTARQGDRGKAINFCNRKRPAGAIFTNIRFLGK